MKFPSSWSTESVTLWMEEDPIIAHPTYSIVYPKGACGNISTWYPEWDGIYFDWERSFNNGGEYAMFTRQHMMVPVVAVVLYVLLVFGGTALMRSREHFEVRGAMGVWNLALSIFSWCGALRLMPQLLATLANLGFRDAVCLPSSQTYGAIGASGFWTMLFIFSKFPELGDTAFIVLGKRKLLFLHWYHHVTVLLYTWHAYATRTSAGLWFMAMNYSVHAVMYLYFALMTWVSMYTAKAKRIEDPTARDKAIRRSRSLKGCLGACAPLITIMQLTQMVVGIGIFVAVYKFKQENEATCFVTRSNVLAGFLMYLSYFILFTLFAVRRYCLPSPKKNNDKKKEV